MPWIERRLTGDTAEHHLLDRPRDRPGRTAAGAAAITFVAVLFLGGSQDVIAGTFDISIGRITAVLQIAAVVAPPIVGYAHLPGLPGAPLAARRPSAPSAPVRSLRLPDGGYEAADRDEPDRATVTRRVRSAGTGAAVIAAATPLTEQAHDIDRIWNGFLLIAVLVGAFVAVLIGYVDRALPAPRRPPPPQVRDNIPMELAYDGDPVRSSWSGCSR